MQLKFGQIMAIGSGALLVIAAVVTVASHNLEKMRREGTQPQKTVAAVPSPLPPQEAKKE